MIGPLKLVTWVGVAAALVFGFLWLTESCSQSSDEAYARMMEDSVAVLMDTLEVHRERTEDLEERLTLERSRAEAIVVQAEAEIQQAERRARVARGRVDTLVAAVEGPEGDSLRVALEREREEHRTVVEALEARDSARVAFIVALEERGDAWRDRAIAAETWGEAAATEADAWERAFHDKQGSGLSLVDRILPEGKLRTAGKGVLCIVSAEGVRRVTGSTEAGLALGGGCIVGAFVF